MPAAVRTPTSADGWKLTGGPSATATARLVDMLEGAEKTLEEGLRNGLGSDDAIRQAWSPIRTTLEDMQAEVTRETVVLARRLFAAVVSSRVGEMQVVVLTLLD